MLGADPLLSGDIDLEVVLIVIVKTIIVFALLLVLVMFYIWFMRKVIADMQNRIGPAKAGPWGILQTLADGIKLFFKEQSIPDSADRAVFRLAPVPLGAAGVPRVLDHPDRRRGLDRSGTRRTCSSPTRRSACCSC